MEPPEGGWPPCNGVYGEKAHELFQDYLVGIGYARQGTHAPARNEGPEQRRPEA
jgi:hypothetical protein